MQARNNLRAPVGTGRPDLHDPHLSWVRAILLAVPLITLLVAVATNCTRTRYDRNWDWELEAKEMQPLLEKWESRQKLTLEEATIIQHSQFMIFRMPEGPYSPEALVQLSEQRNQQTE